MIMLIKDGTKKFVADSLIPAYRKNGWLEEGEITPPPAVSSEEQTSSEETVDDNADGEFVCSVCGKAYKTEAGLSRHMAKEHPET